jgi:hypothetical protein
LLNDTIAMAQTLDQAEIAIMCPASDVEDLSIAVANAIRVVPQTGNGLAAALDSVFEQFAAAGRSASSRSTATVRTCLRQYLRRHSTYSKPATWS